jgi:hypothetical protein
VREKRGEGEREREGANGDKPNVYRCMRKVQSDNTGKGRSRSHSHSQHKRKKSKDTDDIK